MEIHAPFSREGLQARLETFQVGLWFAKPAPFDPLTCARHGWSVVGEDMLGCPACKARLCVPGTDPALVQPLVPALASRHRPHCPFVDGPCPEGLLMPRSRPVLLAEYEARVRGWGDGCAEARVRARHGWEAAGTGGASCVLCGRVVPLPGPFHPVLDHRPSCPARTTLPAAIAAALAEPPAANPSQAVSAILSAALSPLLVRVVEAERSRHREEEEEAGEEERGKEGDGEERVEGERTVGVEVEGSREIEESRGGVRVEEERTRQVEDTREEEEERTKGVEEEEEEVEDAVPSTLPPGEGEEAVQEGKGGGGRGRRGRVRRRNTGRSGPRRKKLRTK